MNLTDVDDKIINKANELGIQAIYGDTDSIFLKNPSESQINALAKLSERSFTWSLMLTRCIATPFSAAARRTIWA
jgi:cysteinyl-tRNA synthetase